MGCACNKRRAVSANGTPAPAGTYRVYVGTRKVYETSNGSAAETVAGRFDGARVLAPGESL